MNSDLLNSLLNKPDDEVTLKDILLGIRTLRDDLDERLSKIEQKVKEIDQVKSDVSEIRAELNETKATLAGFEAAEDPFPPNLSVLVTGLPAPENEDDYALLLSINSLFTDGLELSDISIDAVKRMPPRSYAAAAAGEATESTDDTKPGAVKVKLASLPQKIKCLRNKQKLKQKDTHKGVFIRSCEDHASRLNRLNMDTLLREMNVRDSFRFTGSGRLLRKDGTDPPNFPDSNNQRVTRQSYQN